MQPAETTDHDVPPPAARRARLLGLDVARALALLGMVLAHFPYLDGTGGDWRAVTRFVDGKAMPLFVFVGGAGLTLLTESSRHPVRQVLGRAAFLLVLGLVLVEHVPLIAVILHFYAAYFVVGLVVRKLPGAWLLVVAAVVAVVGGFTWLWLTPRWTPYRGWQGWATLRNPLPLLGDLTVTGVYPVLPCFAFFAVGMWVARLPLGDRRVQLRLVVAGALLAVVGYGVFGTIGYARLDDALLEDRNGQLVLRAEVQAAVLERFGGTAADLERRLAQAQQRTGADRHRAVHDLLRSHERASRTVRYDRLLDPVGHGAMPGWVVGATGFALAVTGACLLAATRFPRATHPLAMAGQLALTFYVGHALLLRWWWFDEVQPRHPYTRELAGAVLLFALFVAFATLWRRHFRRGPLESILRWSGGPG